MAVLIPRDLGRDALRASKAELLVREAFTRKLPDDHTLYQHERLTGRRPQMVLVGPAVGVVLIDVRLWSSSDVTRVTSFDIEVRDASGTTHTSMEHLRAGVVPIERALAGHAAATNGEAWCPVTQVLVLPNLDRADLDTVRGDGTLRYALRGHDVLTREDLEGDLFARMREIVPSPDLTAEQLEIARATLFPQLQVTWSSRSVVLEPRQDELAHLPDLGHHVIDAPAGSGKTVTLIARTRYLRARHPEWKVLVLTFNRVTADLLRAALPPDNHLDVLHFHSWCWRALERGGLEVPALPTVGDRGAYWRQTIPQLLMQGFKANRLAATRFDAILVDDGHDFVPSWYEVIVRALNPETGSLFIVADRHQARRPLDWKACGVNTTGAIEPLAQNYRMPAPIARAARALVDPKAALDGAPASAHGLRGGFAPDVRTFPSREAERKQVLAWLRQRLGGDIAPESILVLGLLRPDMVELETWLEDAGISARLAGGRSLPGSVRLSTVHGAKGLEADFVLLVHAHQLEEFRPDDAQQLLYVAMTRARMQLAIYSHAPSPLLDRLDAIFNPRTITPWAARPRRHAQPIEVGATRD
jgi:UvrD-like helicase C-terminal domain